MVGMQARRSSSQQAAPEGEARPVDIANADTVEFVLVVDLIQLHEITLRFRKVGGVDTKRSVARSKVAKTLLVACGALRHQRKVDKSEPAAATPHWEAH